MSATRQTYLQACLKAERSALDLAMTQLKEAQDEVKRLVKQPVGAEAHAQAQAGRDLVSRLRAAVGSFPPLDMYINMTDEERQRQVEAMFEVARGEEWEVVSNISNLT